MLTVPFTRGSMMMLRFSICPIAVATASISALTKLSVTVSSAAGAPPAPTSVAASAATAKRSRVRLAADMRARLRRRPGSAAIQPDTLGRTVTHDQHVIGVHLFQDQAGRERLARHEAARALAADGEDRAARGENAQQAD